MWPCLLTAAMLNSSALHVPSMPPAAHGSTVRIYITNLAPALTHHAWEPLPAAMERLVRNDVKYRFVLDIASSLVMDYRQEGGSSNKGGGSVLRSRL
jgi:hypothetical protein